MTTSDKADSIPVRPYRRREVFVDLVPIFGAMPYLFAGLRELPARPSDIAGSLMAAAFFLPIAGTAWMQFLMSSTLHRICCKDWRESLALTEVRSRPYLISVLKPRLMIQSLPFVIGLILCAGSPLFGIWAMLGHPEMLKRILYGTIMIYALASMQFCGFCAGLLGLLDRLRSLCSQKGSSQFVFLLSLKWLFIVLLTPALAVGGGVFVEITISGFDESDFFGSALIFYLFLVSSFLNFIFGFSLITSWRKAQAAYFTFE